eukprot:TRINITY_DN9517_c0_g1_i1.p1 TRINITY_DN9517_c0_g1~~TRINITY_DN9517_c0_g1_i1.p1  ORF type:complete len:194 (-),score=40.77 TRINITY_DN9517_c0_g1_i1:318-860(-)
MRSLRSAFSGAFARRNCTLQRSATEISGKVGGGVLLPACAAPDWLVSKLTNDVSRQLAHERVIVNSGGPTGRGLHDPTHVEITDETIDIVFDTVDQYKSYAALMYATDEDIQQLGIPEHLIPVDVDNRTCIGGGATIKLCRKRFLDHVSALKQRAVKPSYSPPPSRLMSHSGSERFVPLM